jgi:hypothetical protein
VLLNTMNGNIINFLGTAIFLIGFLATGGLLFVVEIVSLVQFGILTGIISLLAVGVMITGFIMAIVGFGISRRNVLDKERYSVPEMDDGQSDDKLCNEMDEFTK